MTDRPTIDPDETFRDYVLRRAPVGLDWDFVSVISDYLEAREQMIIHASLNGKLEKLAKFDD